jgi:acyl-CoA thioester hydrolase
VHLFPLRVYYEDTDLSGLVYHANYLKYCERARSDLLRVLGIDQRAAHEAGEGNYAVAEAHLSFLRPARLDDSLVVQTDRLNWALPASGWSSAFRGDEVLVELAIRVGFIGPTGSPRRQPLHGAPPLTNSMNRKRINDDRFEPAGCRPAPRGSIR